MANSLQSVLAQVVSYCAEESLPILDSELTVAGLANPRFENWKTLEVKEGQRGNVAKYRKPSRFSAQDSLALDLVNDGFFTEEFGAIAVDTPKLVFQQISDTELATYPLDELMSDFQNERMAELASVIDVAASNAIVNGGYRFYGDVTVPNTNFDSYVDLVQMSKLFRNYGAGRNKTLHCVLPDMGVARLVQSGLTQFVPGRNEDWAAGFDLGTIAGATNVMFHESSHLPQHISGTASESTGIQITSVTATTASINGQSVPTSTIVLAGLTPGQTILENDLADIGAAAGLKYLQFVGHASSQNNVQVKVITGDTASSGGAATIEVVPQLIYDATAKNPQRNLPRAIVTGSGGDLVRIAKSHQTGVMFVEDTFFMAAPKLPGKTPFPCKTVQSPSGNLSMRTYYGSLLNQPVSALVNDIYVGFDMPIEYASRMLFPLDLSSLLS